MFDIITNVFEFLTGFATGSIDALSTVISGSLSGFGK